jgi:hypothetical protein
VVSITRKELRFLAYYFVISWEFHQLGIRDMATNKDRIKKLEAKILKLKEGTQNMVTKSKMQTSFQELKDFQNHSNHEKGSSSQSFKGTLAT